MELKEVRVGARLSSLYLVTTTSSNEKGPEACQGPPYQQNHETRERRSSIFWMHHRAGVGLDRRAFIQFDSIVSLYNFTVIVKVLSPPREQQCDDH